MELLFLLFFVVIIVGSLGFLAWLVARSFVVSTQFVVLKLSTLAVLVRRTVCVWNDQVISKLRFKSNQLVEVALTKLATYPKAAEQDLRPFVRANGEENWEVYDSPTFERKAFTAF